jgi:hypothetical protein
MSQTPDPVQTLGRSKSNFHSHLRTWGEAGTVKLKDKRAVKIDDRGYTCMFVGYPDSHASDNYCMWAPRSKQVHITRDVIWLKKMFVEQPPTLPAAEIYSINNSLKTLLETNKVYDNLDIYEPAHDPVDNIVNGEVNDDDMTDEEKGKDTNIHDQDEIVATRSGRIVCPPTRFCEFSVLALIEHNKMLMLGDSNTFQSTEELNVMNYKVSRQTKMG